MKAAALKKVIGLVTIFIATHLYANLEHTIKEIEYRLSEGKKVAVLLSEIGQDPNYLTKEGVLNGLYENYLKIFNKFESDPRVSFVHLTQDPSLDPNVRGKLLERIYQNLKKRSLLRYSETVYAEGGGQDPSQDIVVIDFEYYEEFKKSIHYDGTLDRRLKKQGFDDVVVLGRDKDVLDQTKILIDQGYSVACDRELNIHPEDEDIIEKFGDTYKRSIARDQKKLDERWQELKDTPKAKKNLVEVEEGTSEEFCLW